MLHERLNFLQKIPHHKPRRGLRSAHIPVAVSINAKPDSLPQEIRFRSTKSSATGMPPLPTYGTRHATSSLHGLSTSSGPSARMRKAYFFPEISPVTVVELRLLTFACTHAPEGPSSGCSRHWMMCDFACGTESHATSASPSSSPAVATQFCGCGWLVVGDPSAWISNPAFWIFAASPPPPPRRAVHRSPSRHQVRLQSFAQRVPVRPQHLQRNFCRLDGIQLRSIRR